MFAQTKALCQKFSDMGIPCFDLVVYKDGQCVLRHMGGYAVVEKGTYSECRTELRSQHHILKKAGFHKNL